MKCKINDCSGKYQAKGFCGRHYRQTQLGILDLEGKILRKPERILTKFNGPTICSFGDCKNLIKSKNWCNKHYIQFRNGLIDENNHILREAKKIGRNGKGWALDGHGYKYIMLKTHPNCNSNGYVLEHRLVMEKHLGRYLTREEVIHHLNGNRLDNRIENLQLRTSRQEHGFGHENLDGIYKALEILEERVNKSMTDSDSIKKRLEQLLNRITLEV